jgi:hypothetical protein
VLVRLPAIRADKSRVMAECAKIPADYRTLRDVCASMAESPMDYNQTHKGLTEELPSVAHTNLLFTFQDSTWRDATAAWRVGYGGWTWNAKFGDVDNDGWEDLFIVQGTRLRFRNTSNVLYQNKSGSKLEEITRAAGLHDHSPTGAFLYLDFDLDGDLDLLTYPFQLTPTLWRNDGARGPGFEVSLEDRRTANRHGVGARVEILSPDGRRQLRDIKASGGYQSHDLPVARFGLGDWPAVAAIHVRWPDGERAKWVGTPLKPGRYTVVRHER